MNISKLLMSLVLGLLASTAVPSQLDAIGLKPKPARMMDEAFEKVDAADSAIEDKEVARSIALYREALEIFTTIARDYPLWNPELLDLKRSYCEHQLGMALEIGGETEFSVPTPVPSAAAEDPRPAGTDLPAPAAVPPASDDGPTKEELLDIIDDLRRQLKARSAAKGDQELVAEYNKLSREHTELQGEYSQLQLRYEKLQKERDDLTEDSTLSGKDQRMLKKQVDELTKNGVQLLNDKKQLQREVAILKAEKEELKALIADGGRPSASVPARVAGNTVGPPSPTDSFASDPAPAVPPRPAAAASSSGDPVLFPSLADKYKDEPPAITPSRPAPSPAAAASPEHQKLKELIKAGKFNEAVRRADQYLAVTPNDPQLLLMKGMAGCRSGNFDAAIDALQRLTTSVPTHENGWVLLGTAYMAKKNTWKASESFHKALSINPNSPEANYNMAQILVSVDDLEAARQCYMRCLNAGGRRDAALEKQLNR